MSSLLLDRSCLSDNFRTLIFQLHFGTILLHKQQNMTSQFVAYSERLLE